LGLRILEVALAALLREHPESSCVVASVTVANEPSHRVFRRLGFEVMSNTARAVEYRRAL
jgi:RimJ/RimL family protein N-acetyltransferase